MYGEDFSSIEKKSDVIMEFAKNLLAQIKEVKV